MKNIFRPILLGILVLVSYSCETLDVENPNNPSEQMVLENPAEYIEVIESGFYSWWNAVEKNVPQWPLSITGQVMTSSFGNWGGWDFGRIPREPIQNTLNYTYREALETPFSNLNAAIAGVNSPMRLIVNEGREVIVAGQNRTNEALAKAKAVQGLAAGYVALLYDQGYVVDETTDLTQVELRPYGEVMDFAQTKLTEAIQLSVNNTFTVTGFNGLQMSNVDFAKFLRSMKAKFMAYNARNAADTESNDWTAILALTNEGITTDFAPVGDGNLWWQRIKIQGQDGGWGRVSQRMMNMMDDRFVFPWPDGTNTFPRMENPRDKRIVTDMVYNASVPFPAARGYYFYGNYHYFRFSEYRATLQAPMMHTPVSENDLLKAEALIRTGGSKIEAATLINKTRVNRGELAPLLGTESNDALLYAITYERLVEHGWTSAGVGYFTRRMTTVPSLMLQPGSVPSLPVPARELNILGLPAYTLGGV